MLKALLLYLQKLRLKYSTSLNVKEGKLPNQGYLTDIQKVKGINKTELDALQPVLNKFSFRAHEHYLSLINWQNPDDPIKKIIIPNLQELEKWGRLDASNEKDYSIMPGFQHKYTSTAVMLISNVCGGFCRFCFRKRLFLHPEMNEYIQDLEPVFSYIEAHPEINNVLLTGGDGLILSTSKLKTIISRLRQINHVKIIRIGTKLLAFNPFRILNDENLIKLLSTYSLPEKRIYIMTHFNHPAEISQPTLKAVQLLLKAGVILANQTPMLKGINDSPYILANLFKKLSYIGIPPYYVFICRPTIGNFSFSVPIEKALEIFQKAQMMCSGLAKRARLTMSHASGKIEPVALTDKHIIFRYHRAADDSTSGDIMLFKRNPNAYWFDDYQEIVDTYAYQKPYRCFGPE